MQNTARLRSKERLIYSFDLKGSTTNRCVPFDMEPHVAKYRRGVTGSVALGLRPQSNEFRRELKEESRYLETDPGSEKTSTHRTLKDTNFLQLNQVFKAERLDVQVCSVE